MSIRSFACLALASFAVLGATQEPASGLQMQVVPVFPGLEPGLRPAPIAVEIESKGRAAEGWLTVSSDAGVMRVRVKVPPDRKRRIVTYPQVAAYPDVWFHLETDRGEAMQLLRTSVEHTGNEPRTVAMISDTRGALSEFHKQYGSTTQVVYAMPEEVPDRPVGYAQIEVLLLGKGAERLSAEQSQAIRSWVVEGGSLAIVEPDLAAMQPWRELLTGSQPWFLYMRVVAREFGTGSITAFAVSPFSSKFSGSGIQVIDSLRAVWDSYPLYGEVLSPAVFAGGPASAPGEARVNPFRASLPSISTVLGILTAYFIAVVPLNFLLLRKLKRGELAWVTAPALSLAFAGVFFYAAKDLYAAKTSTSTAAMIVMQEGESEGVALGGVQMFFPRAGSYDLRLDRVDWISHVGTYRYDVVEARRWAGAQFEDRGEIEAERFQVPNLAFRELFFRQRMLVADWFRIEDKGSTILVANRSPYPLKRATLIAREATFEVGDLAPGASKSLAKSALSMPGSFQRRLRPERLLQSATNASGTPVLTGTLEGIRVGPQVGTEVEGSKGVTLICTADERIEIPLPEGGTKPWLP